MSADDHGSEDCSSGTARAPNHDGCGEDADCNASEADENIVDLLSWLLDSGTRARIYVHLRQHRWSTSDEVAEGTDLYPSTVREALAALHEEGVVEREKRANGGAGNNPFQYTATAPADVVVDAVDDLQSRLNAVYNLDAHLAGDGADAPSPVSITVDDEADE